VSSRSEQRPTGTDPTGDEVLAGHAGRPQPETHAAL
jgi:hypothetical protein